MWLTLCCRQAKAKHVIDFENLPDLPAGIFDLAASKDISLKSVVPVSNLLPPDHHYKVNSSLVTCYLLRSFHSPIHLLVRLPILY